MSYTPIPEPEQTTHLDRPPIEPVDHAEYAAAVARVRSWFRDQLRMAIEPIQAGRYRAGPHRGGGIQIKPKVASRGWVDRSTPWR
jgi:hypothetical protein